MKLYYCWSGTKLDTDILLTAARDQLPEEIQALPRRQFIALVQAAIARNICMNELLEMMIYIFDNESKEDYK